MSLLTLSVAFAMLLSGQDCWNRLGIKCCAQRHIEAILVQSKAKTFCFDFCVCGEIKGLTKIVGQLRMIGLLTSALIRPFTVVK